MKNIAKKIYLGLIVLFLYLPILVLVVSSFNDSKILGNWNGFTLNWYVALFQNESIMDALKNTLIIAFLASTIATVLGTMACLAMQKMKKLSANALMNVTNIPMLNAEIVTGLAFMLLFVGISMKLSFSTVLIGHITFCIPYAVLNIMPKVKQMDNSMYEAALDLGASPVYAFFKVTLPELLPGILSGFLMAFTMSIDDFIITHYTRGPGIDTLSTKIYTEVRKGIKPEMYALSTLLFVTVFVLMFLLNRTPSEKQKAKKLTRTAKQIKFRRIVAMVTASVIFVAAMGGVVYARVTAKEYIGEVNVYNWGEYIDPAVIEMFEEKTGYKVNYEEFETNEEMYPIVANGARSYDVICPSDYMIEKMIQNDLLMELNKANIPNLKYIGAQYMKNAEDFDPGNKYAVPYTFGTVGIMYNKTMIDAEDIESGYVNTWDILFDKKYSGNILMQASVRDAFCVALAELGYDINTMNPDELQEATDLLIKQKPIVQAYVVDQVRDKMIRNSAALGVIYSGEAIFMQRKNPDLEYVVPEEGSNFWSDAWVITKDCENLAAAEAWINFMCDPEVAYLNFEYITYSTPNTAAREMIEDEDIRNSIIAFPDETILSRCKVYKYLGQEGDELYDSYWTKVGASSAE